MKLKIALDWTPNVNHIGFYVAQSKGLYTERGIDLTILTPDQDNYAITPAKKVELGQADFALCPMESILSYQTKKNTFALKAIAAIFPNDLSAIVTLANSNSTSPKQLDGKTYASYEARYEDEIVKQMITNDGGQGNIELVYPKKLGIWDTLVNAKFDATWIFMNWEGLQAEAEGIKLSAFKMADFKIPYSYSPVIAANSAHLNNEAYKQFIKATKEGFVYAAVNPQEAAEILRDVIPEKDKNIDLVKSINLSFENSNLNSWGVMKETQVQAYLDWIYEKKLETIKVQASDLITNDLLL